MLLLENVVLIGLIYLVNQHAGQAWYVAPLIGLVFGLIATVLLTNGLTELTLEPTKALWQAILHIAPGNHGVAAPKMDQLRVGRQLVAALTSQIYDLASQVEHPADAEGQPHDEQAHFVLTNLPLPLFLVAADQTVSYANETAAKYLGVDVKDVIGNNIYSLMDMSFPSDNTLDSWLTKVRGKSATAVDYWERVRLFVNDTRPTRLFDLAAYYNQGNATGLETMLVLFDHTSSTVRTIRPSASWHWPFMNCGRH